MKESVETDPEKRKKHDAERVIKKYEDRLRDAGLTTLKERRRRGNAIEAFKTLKGINNVMEEDLFDIVDEAARPTRANTEVTEEGERRRENVLRNENARLEIRRNWFNVRAAREWNEIPESVRNASSTNAFKNAYTKWVTQNNQNHRTA